MLYRLHAHAEQPRRTSADGWGVDRGSAAGGRRAPRLRHPGCPQPRRLRRADARCARDRARPRSSRAGRGVHGRRLHALVRSARRGPRDDGTGGDQRAHTARRIVRRLPARAGPHVGRSGGAGRPRGGRAPRAAEPDRLLPASQPLGGDDSRSRSIRTRRAARLRAVPHGAPRTRGALAANRSADGNDDLAGQRSGRPSSRVRPATDRAGGRSPRSRAAPGRPHRGRHGERRRGGRAGRARSTTRRAGHLDGDGTRRDAGDRFAVGRRALEQVRERSPSERSRRRAGRGMPLRASIDARALAEPSRSDPSRR